MQPKILVDYLSFSISVGQFLGHEEDVGVDEIFELMKEAFGLLNLDFEQRGGYHGYKASWWYSGITLACQGNGTVHLNMSGTGCRTWETLHPGQTWEAWLAQLIRRWPSLHFSRLDIACDTFGEIDIKQVQQYTREEKFISKWRTWLIQEGNAENSVVFGSSKSVFRCRIYDKTLERRKRAEEPGEVPEGWVRVEFQLRNEAAESFYRSWTASHNIGETFCGILRNQLLFVEQYDGHNLDRAVWCTWWMRLIGAAERIAMSYAGGVDYNFQSLGRYVIKQAGSSIRTYLAMLNGDVSAFLGLISARKLNSRQKELLRLSSCPGAKGGDLDV